MRPNASHALLVIALLTLVPLALAATANAPVLTAGDFFDTKVTVDVNGVAQESTRHAVVQGVEPIAVGDAAYDAYKIVATTTSNSTISGYPSTTQSTTTTWMRTSDGAALRATSTTTTTTTIPNLPAQTTTSTTETIYNAPCVGIHWPLAVAAKWSTVCTFTTKTTTNGATTTNTVTSYSNTTVDKQEPVTVDAGTFAVTFVLIQTTSDPTTGANSTVTSWYAPDACTTVKSTSGSGAGTFTSELTSFKCASTGSTTPTPTTTSTPSATTTPVTSTPVTSSPSATTTSTTVETSTTRATASAPAAATSKTPMPELALVLAAGVAIALLARKRS